MKIFQLKEIHFIILIILFTGILHLLDDLRKKEYKSTKNNIPEVGSTFFADSLNQKTLCLVLFYTNDSDIYNEMTNNLENLLLRTDNIHIYKINTDKYPDIAYTYNICGVPNILIFRNGIEDKRIMGVVSYSNLEMIYKRQAK